MAWRLRGLPHEARAQVRAVGQSGQMHGAVLLDAAHAPIRPAILWNDGRAEGECAATAAAEPDVGVLSGAPPMPGLTAPTLLWLARHERETHARIAHVPPPKDYLGLRMHGGCVTDPSDAAGTGWLDQRRRRWSESKFSASSALPTLRRVQANRDSSGCVTRSPAAGRAPPGASSRAARGSAASAAISPDVSPPPSQGMRACAAAAPPASRASDGASPG